jgi:glutamate/tyrosine decarboxylase-like PLP-dependent enzyme
MVPAALAANWLAGAWNQNAALRVMSPIAAELEEVVLRWVCEALGLPPECSGGLVTCATMANFTALVTARHVLLARAGWDVTADGMFGAPPIEVVVGAEVHASILKALSLAGFGRKRVTIVEADGQGRIRADKLPRLSERTIVCIQAGNVNTGAFDPAVEICHAAAEQGAWVHVDGAFGLWARISHKFEHLTRGFEKADSWAALKSLGRSGLCAMIEGTCAHARRFAQGLRAGGFEVLNDVVINQVLVSFGRPEVTREVIRRVQEDGTCWCGGTVWQGKPAMRISVSSWATTESDVEYSLQAILRIASECRAM